MEKKVNNLIKFLESNGANNVDNYNGLPSSGFEYYFSISGFLKYNYFDISIRKHLPSQDVFHEISRHTDHVEELKELLNKQNYIKFD